MSLQRKKMMNHFGMTSPVSPLASEAGIRVVNLSLGVRLLLPPLFFSSIPRRAIGFSFPRGRLGLATGVCLLGVALLIGGALSAAYWSVAPMLFFLWILGSTGAVLIYNSVGGGIAFVKPLCSACRLRPIIEEHEAIHLSGAAAEETCWEDARRRYSYSALGLAGDPRICSFCPIARRLREGQG